MKNLPMFTTENGIASLTLEEIPFSKKAYIRIQSSVDADALLAECTMFCKAVGAEKIYVTGIELPRDHFSVLQMSRLREGLDSGNAVPTRIDLFDMKLFRSIYNDSMYNIQNASYLTERKAIELIKEGACYFVYDGKELIGIGIAKGEWVHAITSLKHGMGEAIMLALNRVLTGERIWVEVVDTNYPALHLYKRMNFTFETTVSKWYEIF